MKTRASSREGYVQLRCEQMMVGLLRLRLAAGICVLAAAGRLPGGGGGAVAVADPSSNDSAAHGHHETNASAQPEFPRAKKLKDEPGSTGTKDGSLGSGGEPGEQHSTAAKKPKNEPGGTDTKDGARGSGGHPGQQPSPREKAEARA